MEVHLALAKVADILLQHRSAHQLSLQALATLQSTQEEGTEEERAMLRACDVHLWLEARCWLVRSVVGLLALPGGVAVLGGEEEGGVGLVSVVCEECGELGDMELRAEVELLAALHAISFLPCQLQQALDRSQV